MLHTRTHGKALVLPVLALVLTGAGVGAGTALVPGAARPLGQLAVAVLGLALVGWWTVRPFLRWLTTTCTLTTRRLVVRRGVLSRTSMELPLSRVLDVSSERSLSDRVLGCGTLLVQTAAEGGPVALVDVPDVEHVHQVLSELLLDGDSVRPSWSEAAEDQLRR